MLDFLKELIQLYSTPIIQIVASFSDGDLFTPDDEQIMHAWNQQHYNLFWHHIPDASHAVRNVRGAFLIRELLIPGFAVTINASKLIEL